MARALITGITGQDGSYLAELLLSKGYEVHGIVRRSSSLNTSRIDHIFDRLHLHHGDLLDAGSLRRAIDQAEPDEIYNLAAQSHVRVSFDEPEYSVDTVMMGTLRLLEAVRDAAPKARVYQASSSEMFGSAPAPQSEATPFRPRSPYGVAKVAAHWTAVNYREAHGLFVSTGILFNHESPRRGETFVTRKITRAITRMKMGLQDHVSLGNLSARRDWGFAGDYVEAMWLMLQQPSPDDFVIATGQEFSIHSFIAESERAAQQRLRIIYDERYTRPTEVDHLCGDASKARHLLGWRPRVDFRSLVQMMVDSDMVLARREAHSLVATAR